MDDPLNAVQQTTIKASALDSLKKEQNNNDIFSQQRSTPTAANPKMKKQLKKCCFCDEQYGLVMIKKSFTTKPYCLFHYYTTKACRIDTSKVSLIEIEASDEFRLQLVYIQEIFAEAFTELQKEISTEANKSFQSMVERGNDPLSILIDSCKQNRVKHPKPTGSSMEGGFMRHLQNSKESKLMEEQLHRNELAARESVSSIHNNVNLSKRRKISLKSSWHLVFDKKPDYNEKNNHDWDIKENKDSISGMKCSCGSHDIILCGNITGRNDEIPKAEIWGLKRDNEVSSRFQCINCSKIWNQDG